MTSSRPYLIRALYEWIVDNNLTPYIVVNADVSGTIVPMEYVRDGNIILNVAPEVVSGLALGNDAVQFKARFSGVPRQIYAPIVAISAIYAKENGRGMVFNPEEAEEGADNASPTPPTDDTPPTSTPPRSKPNLKIVK